ncbi:MAG TPA: EAL domain-containing protein, partial [Candidatus Dormibacteraeota bacterium]|nr:EAL domain-containing protein [Candidatus Dormibacteraeota bacterium]
VQLLPNNRTSTKIVRAIIALAHSLDCEAHAEGVEEESQLRWLLTAECDKFQGFHISAPLHSGRFEEWLSQTQSESLPSNGLQGI